MNRERFEINTTEEHLKEIIEEAEYQISIFERASGKVSKKLLEAAKDLLLLLEDRWKISPDDWQQIKEVPCYSVNSSCKLSFDNPCNSSCPGYVPDEKEKI